MASAASSGSSQVTSRGSSHGVPTRCWCGAKVVTFVSKTTENPYRRFYRCETALKRRNEHHLFTWVDDALLEEIRMVDAKHERLVEDVNDFRKSMMDKMENEKAKVEEMEERMMTVVMEKIEKELCVAKVEMENMSKDITWSILKRTCVIVVALTILAWFYQVMAP